MESAKDAIKSAKTTTEKGQAFEEKVARWAKKRFNTKGMKRNQLFKGKTAVRPFEVDIVGYLESTDQLKLILSDVVFWIECKDRKSTIKRTDINKFWDTATDVKKAVPAIAWSFSEEQKLMNWDYLIFASTAKFDADAINFAKEHNMACFYYDGKIFQEIVGLKSF